MAKTVAFIQARMASTRLPRKVLLPLQGVPVLQHVIQRTRAARLVSDVVVVTTMEPEDLQIVALCASLETRVFCGSVNDVLDRFYQAARIAGADNVVRITADCPVMDPGVIDRVVEAHLEGKADYTSNVLKATFPDGEDVEVVALGALEKAWREAALLSEREHVTPYLRNHPELFRLVGVESETDLGGKRWTVDEPKDYAFLQALYDRLYPSDHLFPMKRVLELLREHPELEQINSSIGRNEGYAKSLREDGTANAKQGAAGGETGQRLYREAKRLIPGGTQLLSKRPEQFLPEGWPSYYSRAKGCEIWDLDGRRFVDMSFMGIGANTLGYADEEVDSAVVGAVGRGSMTTLNAPEEVELANVLLGLHPWAAMVRYARSGGEGMAVAVRIARAATGKDVVLFCGYHGWSDWYLAANLANDKALDGQLLPGLEPRGVPRQLKGTAYPFTYNNVEEFLSLTKRHGKEVGAVVVEAVRNVLPEKAFLEALRSETRRLGVPLVVDEVSSGWRMNLGGAHLLLGLEPDIAVFAKGMSNGYPMAAIIGKAQYMDAAQGSFISSTFWTDRIGPTAALATIAKMKRVEAQRHMMECGRKVQGLWTELAARNGVAAKVSGIYPLSHVEFEYHNPLVMKTLFTQLMLARGFLATTAYYASFAHKEQDLAAYADAVNESFAIMGRGQREGNAETLLAGPVCHSGFRRLT